MCWADWFQDGREEEDCKSKIAQVCVMQKHFNSVIQGQSSGVCDLAMEKQDGLYAVYWVS